MALPLAVSTLAVLVLFAIGILIGWVLYVALRVQRQREATGGKDLDEPTPEPAPDRREPETDAPPGT